MLAERRASAQHADDERGFLSKGCRECPRLRQQVADLQEDVEDGEKIMHLLRQQNAKLKAELTAVAPRGAHDVQELRAELTEALYMCEKLRGEIEHRDDALERSTRELQAVQHDAALREKEAAHFRKLAHEQSLELRTLHARAESKKQTAADLEDLLQEKDGDLTREKGRMQRSVDSLTDQCKAKELAVAKLEKELAHQRELRREDEEAIQLLQRHLREKDETIELLKERWEADLDTHGVLLQHKLGERERGEADLRLTLEESEVANRELRAEVRRLREELRAVRKEMSAERHELARMGEAAVREVREEMQDAVDKEKLELGRVQQELEQLQSAMAREVARKEDEARRSFRDEASALRAKIEQLESALAKHREEAHMTSERFRAEESKWRKCVADKDFALQQAALQLDEAERDHRSREQQWDGLQAAVAEAREARRAAEDERDHALQRLDATRDELRESVALNEDQAAEVQAFTDQLRDMRGEMDHLEGLVEELTQEVAKKERGIKSLESTIEDMKAEAAAREAEVEKLKGELQQAMAVGEEIQKTAGIVQASQRRREEVVAAKDSEIRRLSEQVRERERAVEDMRYKVAELERKVGEREMQVKEVEEVLNGQREVSEKEAAEYYEKERTSRETIAQLHSTLRAATRGREEAVADSERLRKELQELQAVHVGCKRTIFEKEKSVEAAKARARAMEERAEEADDVVRKAKRELQEARNRQRDTDSESLARKVDMLRAQLQDAQERIKDMEEDEEEAVGQLMRYLGHTARDERTVPQLVKKAVKRCKGLEAELSDCMQLVHRMQGTGSRSRKMSEPRAKADTKKPKAKRSVKTSAT